MIFEILKKLRKFSGHQFHWQSTRVRAFSGDLDGLSHKRGHKEKQKTNKALLVVGRLGNKLANYAANAPANQRRPINRFRTNRLD